MRTEKQTEQERNAGKLESTKTKQPNDKKRERRRCRMGRCVETEWKHHDVFVFVVVGSRKKRRSFPRAHSLCFLLVSSRFLHDFFFPWVCFFV
jgi:hypothetical protein